MILLAVVQFCTHGHRGARAEVGDICLFCQCITAGHVSVCMQACKYVLKYLLKAPAGSLRQNRIKPDYFFFFKAALQSSACSFFVPELRTGELLMHVSACWIKAFIFRLLNKTVAGNGKGSKDKNDKDKRRQYREKKQFHTDSWHQI